MNGLVLILLTLCGEQTALVGWGGSIGVGPFFGTLSYVEQDEGLSRDVRVLSDNPATQKVIFEMVSDQEWEIRCGPKA